ncbi:MAG TPA: SDR family oxidoreductase [Humisphaera sp.]|jgi:uncharacterized protein YbjT (DUF2867 family)|nr:SDR family oxidoreductase [Humisphaera sp.]
MILVTGATGTNGIELLNRLSAAGEPARALVRDPVKAEKLLPRDVQLSRGDLDDRASLTAAMEDIEKVFLLCPVAANQLELETNLIDAARQAGVRQIVKFSVIHASADSPSQLIRWHAQAEQHIRSSGIPFTFLRPNIFMQEILRQAEAIKSQNAFYMPFAPDVRLSFVDVRDNAAVAAKVLSETGHESKIYELTGPAAPSLSEVAQTLSNVTGRQINHVQVSMDQWKQGFLATGAPQWLVDLVAELYETFVPANSVVKDGVRQALGRPATSFAQFAADHASQVRG